MKFHLTLILVILGASTLIAFGQQAQETAAAAPVKYDAELAKKLGGNDNGMKSYVLCILKTGPKDASVQGKERDDIFAGHAANIQRLANEGKLAIAGPFEKNDKNYRGLYVFN